MIKKKIQLLILFTITFSIGINAAQQVPPTQQRTNTTPIKSEISKETGGTYRDEIEIIKFDENTSGDSYEIPFNENNLEVKQKNKPTTAK